MPLFQDQKQEDRLREFRKKEAEDLAEILSKKYGLPYLNLFGVSPQADALRVIEEVEAREAFVAPFKRIGNKLLVAVASPQNEKTKEALAGLEKQGFHIETFMVSRDGLEHVWERYMEISRADKTQAGVLDISPEDLRQFMDKVKSLDDISKITKATIDDPGIHTSRVLEVILAGALSTGASDIHIEPEEKQIRMRYRLDGVLIDITFFDLETYKLLRSRIKLISGLKLNVKTAAQDGRFSIKIDKTDIEIRTSVLPGAYGESIVLRVLNPKSILVPLEELGIEPRLLEVINAELKKPNGMILNTGPTGSGKTTTLYAFIRKVYTTKVKVVTIEDPIEYHIEGITQTQTHSESDYTFASGLRSVLRQDPDIILVGEIRDSETANTAINAALTGHLVFSTLHTNNAAGTIPRLIDLGVDAKVLSAALNLFLAQRLVRKLCDACKKEEEPTAEERKLIEGIAITIKRDNVPKLEKIYRAVGCTACNNTGYRGRIGVFEGILMNDQIDAVAISHPNESEIWKAAEPQNLLSMAQDGILKLLYGITSLDELNRVIDLDE
ncbi:MAG: hypothetical protein COW88_01920 [Candidatus Lloydbacteria bacterium CG22_combo_CG10-13_8_21_14_all_47_15]|uniref:Bacterial type II secretion system protein E domain-containing protein n=1 Tax=Candidatus Lloydbacteria bacterium CG22_combo_CG10-13_8_21_14_all_47_15 TaxID=1974635 RepID=A0A2H0CU98_9BACT|nr:MAG: hypothetical protein COW88_01920 [Candidatus Lloydbacteria bacterium CG22_combo_CG10-13_8_21_14_all_47_15]